jgi:hypothetical protein
MSFTTTLIFHNNDLVRLAECKAARAEVQMQSRLLSEESKADDFDIGQAKDPEPMRVYFFSLRACRKMRFFKGLKAKRSLAACSSKMGHFWLFSRYEPVADPLELRHVVQAIVNDLTDSEVTRGRFLPQSVQGCPLMFDRRAKRKNQSPSFAFRQFHRRDCTVRSKAANQL